MTYLQRPLNFIRRHPLWVTTGIACLGVLAATYPLISDFFGGSWPYHITPTQRELRIGNTATLNLVREYAANANRSDVPVIDYECAWSFSPPLKMMGAGTSCQGVQVQASASDFGKPDDKKIDLAVSVRVYRSGKRPDLTANPDATTHLWLLNEFNPGVRAESSVVYQGGSTQVNVSFPDGNTPSPLQCRWTAEGLSASTQQIFKDPESCDTIVTVPRDAIGQVKFNVTITTGNDRPPISRTVTLQVERPPGRYFLLVLDYTSRMGRKWVGNRTQFQDMLDSAAHALSYIDETSGGFAGVTSFGGTPGEPEARNLPTPASQALTNAPDDCANVRALYPFGPLVRTDATKSLSTLHMAGEKAPLAQAILAAYRSYGPFKEDNKDRRLDRFLVTVITGGGDTCGARDLVGLLQDTMSASELKELFVSNKLLTVALAIANPEDVQFVDRMISDSYNQDPERNAVIVRISDRETLNSALESLGKMASRSPGQAKDGCRQFMNLLDRGPGDKRGLATVQAYCRNL